MKRIGNIVALAIAIACLSAPASAADLFGARSPDLPPVRYAPDSRHWSGPYIGLHGGFGWSERGTSLNDGFAKPVFEPGSVESDGDGWLGGVHVGYSRQAGQLLFGVEADLSLANIEGETLVGTPRFEDTDGEDGTAWGIGYTVDYLGTLRGRIGFVAGDFLFYGTGGLAWAQVDETHSVRDGQNAPHATSGEDANHFGWTAGGGLEWQFQPGWMLRTEYLYVDLGETDYAHQVGNKSGAPDLTASDLELHIVRAGVSYRF